MSGVCGTTKLWPSFVVPMLEGCGDEGAAPDFLSCSPAVSLESGVLARPESLTTGGDLSVAVESWLMAEGRWRSSDSGEEADMALMRRRLGGVGRVV